MSKYEKEVMEIHASKKRVNGNALVHQFTEA